ncbi:MAG TPA: hypothetical protein VKU42_01265, partial [Candidatus Angelobacter sp.]|nr:hypothetical protein [Candidatus Angelobacter sp.]
MEDQFSNLWHNWHHDLAVWTRDSAPKLAVILLVSFVFLRLLGVMARKLVSISEKRPANSAIRAQQVRTITGVVRSVGAFLIIFFAGMSILKDAFKI